MVQTRVFSNQNIAQDIASLGTGKRKFYSELDSYNNLLKQLSRPRLLIVDDIADNIDTIEDIMQDWGYEIFKAMDGEEAWVLINQIQPDLILLDAVMPRMDGFEVAKRVRNLSSTRLIPMIMMTSLNSLDDRLRGLECGVDDFISRPVNLSELRVRVHNLLRIREHIKELENAEQVIFSLAKAVEAKDKYTEGHCARLSILSETIGRGLGLGERDLTVLRRGGILHDIGKIAIEDKILSKPGPLSEDEFEIIKMHPEIGENICMPLLTLRPVLPIIRYHHERFNGSGYPEGLAGDEIPLLARIVGIVDCYDSLITQRPYRKALDKQTALDIIDNETVKGLWDPKLVELFFYIIEKNDD
jgi:putative two-component system response regulator